MKHPQGRIIIFAKPPILGNVKTRLHTLLTPAQTVKVYHKMLTQTLDCVSAANLCPVELHWATLTNHKDFEHYCQQHHIITHLQQGDDLGQRLAFGLQSALQHSDYVIAIGADCPVMSADYLATALNALAENTDVVIGPAEDGGYVLIGMRQFHRPLFDEIPWSTDKVLITTRQCIANLELTYQELPTLWDVDDPNDFSRLVKEYAEYANLI